MANSNMALAKFDECSAPELYEAVTDYCFGHADENKRRVVEEHLTVCAVCRREVDGLLPAVGVLRFDKEIGQSVSILEAAGAFGVSGKLNRLFGGHVVFVIVSCVGYALLHGVSVVMEFSKGFEMPANLAMVVSTLVTIWAILTAVTGLFVLWRRTVQGKSRALPICLGIFSIATGLLMILLVVGAPSMSGFRRLFPDYFPLEDCVRIYVAVLSLAIFYFIIPYHFILALQRELQMEQHTFVLSLLRHERGSIPPRSTLYIKSVVADGDIGPNDLFGVAKFGVLYSEPQHQIVAAQGTVYNSPVSLLVWLFYSGDSLDDLVSIQAQ